MESGSQDTVGCILVEGWFDGLSDNLGLGCILVEGWFDDLLEGWNDGEVLWDGEFVVCTEGAVVGRVLTVISSVGFSLIDGVVDGLKEGFWVVIDGDSDGFTDGQESQERGHKLRTVSDEAQ